MEDSLWNKLKKFINENEIFTRKDINNHFGFINNSLDTYVLIIKKTEFIFKYKDSVAKYKRIHVIPEYITINIALKMANDENYRKVYYRKIYLDKLKNIDNL